ncbi:hypothetical protein ACFQ9X_56755 [Catenulispora yoronensis]
MPDDLTHAVPADPRAAVTALLHRLLAASNDPDARTEDALAFAVTEHASALRKQDPAAVTPRMIAAAEMLNHGAKALTDAANAAREELDAELDALGADATTGLVEGKAVYVDGADGTRYRLSRGHTVTKVFDDDAVIALIAAALRSEYRAPEEPRGSWPLSTATPTRPGFATVRPPPGPPSGSAAASGRSGNSHRWHAAWPSSGTCAVPACSSGRYAPLRSAPRRPPSSNRSPYAETHSNGA